MIDREFLEDYQQETDEDSKKLGEAFLNGDFSAHDRYLNSRIHNLSSPLAMIHHSFQFTTDEPIWSVIPLSGSTLIPLIAFPKHRFEGAYKIKIKEIPDVVDYVKTEGKLQFYLVSRPLDFTALDFLEPILAELRPPILAGITAQAYFDSKEVKKYVIEFDTLADVRLKQDILNWSRNHGSISMAEEVLQEFSTIYTFLKCMRYEQLVNEIEEAMLTDLGRNLFLYTLGKLLIKPLEMPIQTSLAMTKDFQEQQKRYFGLNVIPQSTSIDLSFPGEIGRFLFKRLVHCAPTLDACKQLVYLYKDRDIYKLGTALNEAILSNKPEIVKDKSLEVSTILENIWEDKGLPNRIRGVRTGFVVLFAVVGTILNGLAGTGIGLLSGLGFNVADRLFKFQDEMLSEKIGKLFSSSYEAIVYDFKQKYPTTTSTRKL